MKKILFVASSLTIGGMERVLADIANALVKRSYDVTILTYEKSQSENYIGDLDERVHFLYKAHRTFPFLGKLPYVHRYFNPQKRNWETRASARTLYRYYVGANKGYDVEIAFCRGPAVKIVSGSDNKNSVKLTWVHNDYSLLSPKSITKFFKNTEEMKKAYRCFDKIVAVSEMAREKFVEVVGFEEKTRTIYNMLDVKMILQKKAVPCPEPKNKFTIISVARVLPAKGFDKLLKAVEKLNDDGLDFNVWLIGTLYKDSYEKQLVDYIKEHRLTNVKLFGRKANPYCYMSSADVYICSSWREGFSISVAEAMTCGLPVISTRCTGPTEILDNGKYGILIDYDETQMYAALKKFILRPDLLAPYRGKSLQRSADFASDKVIDQVIDLF